MGSEFDASAPMFVRKDRVSQGLRFRGNGLNVWFQVVVRRGVRGVGLEFVAEICCFMV